MDDSLSQALIRLPRKAVRRMAWRPGDGLAVFEGQVWITQDDDTGDTVLGAGESRCFPGDGDLLVEAFADAALIRLRADDRIDAVTPRSGDAERPPPRISAYALMLAASHAAVGRALWRAAGALACGAAWPLAAGSARISTRSGPCSRTVRRW